MEKNRPNRKIVIFLLFLILLAIYSVKLGNILFYSSDFNIIKGESKNLDLFFPFSLDLSNENQVIEPIFNSEKTSFKRSYSLSGNDIGNAQVKLKILGLIPIKNYNVNVIDRPELVPAGNAIGVSLNTKGVLIVAMTDVINMEGKRVSPAKDAGLKIGDNIVEINGEKILNSEHLVKILNNLEKREIEITVFRNKGEFKTTAIPVKSLQDNSYRLGIWVRDKTTGIGTLTYYNLKNKTFGALGHGITDLDTNNLLTVEDGLIMKAKVADIEHGKRGEPGEIKGVFYKTDEIIGKINLNNDFGLYGNLNEDYIKKRDFKPIPIAFKEEVELGKAQLLTTLDKNTVEKFDIRIVKLETQNKESQKSMVIEITDPKLLKKTGGIVQGMSGSPIIQKGKIVGAVTHVFVNDPSKGYGLYIEWMLNQEDRF